MLQSYNRHDTIACFSALSIAKKSHEIKNKLKISERTQPDDSDTYR